MKTADISRRSGLLLIACILATVPAFVINLGVMPYTSDEPTRAIVTLEMIWSGNFITPTFTGEYYYNKPPLFNWLLVPFLSPSGAATEWYLRLPTLISLLGFSLSIFWFIRRWFGHHFGLLSAFLFVTCGRILFWDSMLGLIDILYSWITFASFVVVINGVMEQKWRKMFLLSYLLAAMGFMLKGVPSIAFQGLTLITALAATGQTTRVFSRWHFAGIGVFLLVTGTYLWAYSRENSLQQYLAILWDQSSQRTAAKKGISDSLIHLVMFHPKMVYHFLPWSLAPLLLLFRRNRRTIIGWFQRSEPIHPPDDTGEQRTVVRIVILVFAANVLIYWLSPATIPRYVLMLAPLTFLPALLLLKRYTALYASIPWIISGLLMLRIAFNLFYLPVKAERVAEQQQKHDAIRMAETAGDTPVHIVGKSWIDHATIIYMMTEMGQVIRQDFGHYATDRFYLADAPRYTAMHQLPGYRVVAYDSTLIRHGNGTAYFFRIEQKQEQHANPEP